uniref:Uncharacterized protein n=1 Tax=Anguilla anguilla TaxID=7936 RepID=A0A0E9RRH5_ANGAN
MNYNTWSNVYVLANEVTCSCKMITTSIYTISSP